MIHRIASTEIELADTESAERCNVIPQTDYHDLIVKKPWGYEYLAFQNEHVAIWMLHIARTRRTSMHCHPRKKTGLALLSGHATFQHADGAIELNPLDGVIIERGAFHLTEASSNLPITPASENGIWVLEIESPPLKTDLVRMNDLYGRTGAGYEGSDQTVVGPESCLRLDMPEPGGVREWQFFACRFTVSHGFLPAVSGSDALVSIIGVAPDLELPVPLGELTPVDLFQQQAAGFDLGNLLLLTIERTRTMMKVTDFLFAQIAKLGVREVFAISGGGAMHLVDSAGSTEGLRYIAVHHEQAATMAAEGHARITGKPGVALVTSGPGGTNAITGVCGAWIDSIPMVVISGQVTTDTLIEDTGLRQFGIQESNIVEQVQSITKYAVTVKDPATIRYHLEKALHLAVTGRPGPVWLDIPLDVQGQLVDLDSLTGFTPEPEADIQHDKALLQGQVADCLAMLRRAQRPVLITGYGVRLAGAEAEIVSLVEQLGIPVISSWTSSDLFPTDHPLYIGRSGIMGDRAGNFTVQNADLLLIVGSRMSIPQVGYNFKTFAREAKRIVVDIDRKELDKPSIRADLPIHADARAFITELSSQIGTASPLAIPEWLGRCRDWKTLYPVVLPEYKLNQDQVNSFYFIDQLSERLGSDAVVVTDMGTSFTCTMQTFRVKSGQRLFTSSGHASMGFGLPGAIGACLGNNSKKVVCISGDGGLQMNIQELQTLVTYRLPIILFVLNNRGYLTIKLMQQNHFGRYVGSDPGSGVVCPDLLKIAAAYGIPAERISTQAGLEDRLDAVLAQPGPFICEIMMPENQPLIPRVSSLKKPDGTITAKPLEDLYPFLDRDEFYNNMIVTPVEVINEK
ncbi:thiamine pyrophosphate-dependent enzyme [Trichlorobacter lovleyi]|uniref:thiamine pyrophosphate-dependent enzyme n=1 Tax=Trichlorobacter lovleyi TaxID=313985 RepID=UPI003D0EADEA